MGMKVDLNDATYEVSFRRATRVEGEHDLGDLDELISAYCTAKDRHVVRATVCVINRLEPVEGQKPKRLVESDAASFCFAGDVFDKELGRKVALGRALEMFPRHERGVFWTAYLNRGNSNV